MLLIQTSMIELLPFQKRLTTVQHPPIEEFSKRIDLLIRDVSAVINKRYGTNFFEFMNKYRVEETKRLLLDKKLL